MMPLVSVIVPFYNLERYVSACLDSVIAAAGLADCAAVGVEVVCVDDGSTDSTPRLLDEYAASKSAPWLSIRVIHQPNGGEGAARNTGISAARGEWLTFLDGDDMWLENHLKVALPLLRIHPDADMVALKYAQFDDGSAAPAPTCAEGRVFDLSGGIVSGLVLEVGVFPTFFRRGFIAGAKFSALPLGADRLFTAQCLARAEKVVKCDAVVHGYRVRAGSMARAAWDARKVVSQCDYAFGSLEALAVSGRRIGREGLAYLASLWLSDVPNRVSRLKGDARRGVWERWRGTLGSGCVRTLPRFDRVRRLLRGSAGVSMRFSLIVARLLRKGGLS